jgi:hypothetical protein
VESPSSPTPGSGGRVLGAPESAPPTPPTPPAEPRQRLRITVAREPVDADRVGRMALDAWQLCLQDSGLPIAGLEAPNGRARLAIAAPLPAMAGGVAELIDLWLLERLPTWRVREALAPRLPDGYRWVGAEDVWLGEPPLPGRVAASDWRIELGGDDGPQIDGEGVARAAAAIVAAVTLPRTRIKAGAEKPYDLRPLILGLSVEPGPPVTVLLRTRIDPELGSGRPEEVLSALGEAAGAALEVASITRIGLLLTDDPGLRAGRTR